MGAAGVSKVDATHDNLVPGLALPKLDALPIHRIVAQVCSQGRDASSKLANTLSRTHDAGLSWAGGARHVATTNLTVRIILPGSLSHQARELLVKQGVACDVDDRI